MIISSIPHAQKLKSENKHNENQGTIQIKSESSSDYHYTFLECSSLS